MCINTTRLCSTRVCICYYLAPPFRRRFTSTSCGRRTSRSPARHISPHPADVPPDKGHVQLGAYDLPRLTPYTELRGRTLVTLVTPTYRRATALYSTATDLRCRYESSYHSKSGDLKRLVTRCKAAELMLKGPTVVHPRDWRGQLSTYSCTE